MRRGERPDLLRTEGHAACGAPNLYPGAGHGLINDHDPADATLSLTVLNKISGTRYHEPSARDAHRRIAAFFGRHLTT